MKILIIGLGSLGSKLAAELLIKNKEADGIDLNLSRLMENKDVLNKTFQLDACKKSELKTLVLKEYQKIVVSIGSNYENSNLLISLLLSELNASEIIVQYLSQIQKMALETVGINNFINPLRSSIDELIQFIIKE